MHSYWPKYGAEGIQSNNRRPTSPNGEPVWSVRMQQGGQPEVCEIHFPLLAAGGRSS